MNKGLVWVVDDDESIAWVLNKAITSADLRVELFTHATQVLENLVDLAVSEYPQVIISDIRMPGMDGFELLKQLHQLYPQIPVIIMTAYSDLESAVRSYQDGAFEYLPKPFDIDEALSLVYRALERSLQHNNSQTFGGEGSLIIGEAPAMQEVFRIVGRLAQSSINVLITGESGTGKDLVARALHLHSPRKNKAFIALNMAAIPKDLIESELFGHEKGAFTGANVQLLGYFEQAAGGTLFLDEIGDMPLDAQTRLLRVLSDNKFYRVGGRTTIEADVRIIAATHQDLESLVRQGLFREDLYHRLNVIRIYLPKLSERQQDIPKLARHFLYKAAKELNFQPKTLLPETITYLSQLPWPGNVRQLENTCRWLTVMATGRDILVSDLPTDLVPTSSQLRQSTDWQSGLRKWADEQFNSGAEGLLDKGLVQFERIMIESALEQTAGRKGEAAKLLGWGRNTLTRKLQELDINCDQVDKS